MYRVIKYFTDLTDNNFPYNVGDVFPREGKEVSADRIMELSTAANKQGAALIEEVRGAEKPVSVAEVAEEITEDPVPVESEPKKRGKKRKD